MITARRLNERGKNYVATSTAASVIRRAGCADPSDEEHQAIPGNIPRNTPLTPVISLSPGTMLGIPEPEVSHYHLRQEVTAVTPLLS